MAFSENFNLSEGLGRRFCPAVLVQKLAAPRFAFNAGSGILAVYVYRETENGDAFGMLRGDRPAVAWPGSNGARPGLVAGIDPPAEHVTREEGV